MANYQQFQQNLAHQQQYPQQQPYATSSQAATATGPNGALIQSDQTGTAVYLALVGLADQFQRSKHYRQCIHCMESILTLKPQEAPVVRNFHVQLKTRLNLCRLYLRHTVNTNQYVNIHLEKAVLLIKNVRFY
jgi:hypothetical protein